MVPRSRSRSVALPEGQAHAKPKDAAGTHTSYDQFAGRATVPNFLPLLAERFAR